MRPTLTKSDYVAALQCRRRLWLAVRDPGRAGTRDAMDQVRIDEGLEIGRLACARFAGGVRVEGTFEQAQERTRALLADPQVPALFEAAFEHGGVRVRADVVERLDGGFGLREVKAGATFRQDWLDDVVIQLWVLRGCGVDVRSVEVLHVDEAYAGTAGPPNPARFLMRRDVLEDAEFLLADVGKQVPALFETVGGDEPDVEPSPHCRRPRVCPFLDSCLREKGEGWIGALPGLTSAVFHDLRERGVARIAEIPDEVALAARQRRAVEAHRGSGGPVVSSALPSLLRGSGPPASYLDFETVNPGIPCAPGARPFQPIACQWSVHHVDADGRRTHAGFLADLAGDPRRAVAETLIAELGVRDEPVLVYSGFEATVLAALAEALPDLGEPLARIRARLFDLLPVVRSGVYARGFAGSFSLKRVAPALVPGLGYADLASVANGGEAALALTRLTRGDVAPAERESLRAALLRYCERDTLALLEVHAALRRLAG